MKRTYSFIIIMLLMVMSIGIASAQIGRQFGARRLLLDNNDGNPANTLYFIDVNGTLAIDNTGIITGSYPTS
ncbi:MAG: hypothetical protein Q8896_05390, partial [Bacteroidota bacterium]|nr:hypothetical protein [Bacteroidota bacterium]